jgi:hypothetical protein
MKMDILAAQRAQPTVEQSLRSMLEMAPQPQDKKPDDNQASGIVGSLFNMMKGLASSKKDVTTKEKEEDKAKDKRKRSPSSSSSSSTSYKKQKNKKQKNRGGLRQLAEKARRKTSTKRLRGRRPRGRSHRPQQGARTHRRTSG